MPVRMRKVVQALALSVRTALLMRSVRKLLYHQSFRNRRGQYQKTRTWYLDLWVGGKRRRTALGGDIEEAERKARELLGRTAAGLDVPHERLRLNDLLKLVEDDYQAHGRRTTANLSARFEHLRAFFGNPPAKEITADRVRAYQAERQRQGRKNATINVELAALGRGFSLAQYYDRIDYKPKIQRLTENNARKGFFERPDFDAVLAHVPPYLVAFFMCCYLTGWRPKRELLTREWKHVDLSAGWLRLEPHETKNGDGRQFPLIPGLRAVLEDQRLRCTEAEARLGRIIPWVFFTDKGGRATHYQAAWEAARVKAGMPNRIVYDLRRTCVRNLERAGVPRSAAMSLVGHRTQAIYYRYAISDEAMLREAADKMTAFHEERRAISVLPFGR